MDRYITYNVCIHIYMGYTYAAICPSIHPSIKNHEFLLEPSLSVQYHRTLSGICPLCIYNSITICEKPGFQYSQYTYLLQFSSVAQSCPQHARPPCPSQTAGVYPNSCPLSQWCLPTILSSVVLFSSHPQSFPASGSFQMSQFFTSGGQCIGVSASTSVLPMNTQDWSPLGWTGWIFLQSRGLWRVFSNTTVQKCQFFSAQLSLQSDCYIHTWPLEKPYPWLDGPLLTK